MTNTHIVTVDAIEYRVFTTFSPYGTHAHGIAFNESADTVASAESRQYMGYCYPCIIADTVTRMHPDICPEVLGDTIGSPCHCD